MSLKVMSEYPHYIFLSICLLSTYTLLYSTVLSSIYTLLYIILRECIYLYIYIYIYIHVVSYIFLYLCIEYLVPVYYTGAYSSKTYVYIYLGRYVGRRYLGVFSFFLSLFSTLFFCAGWLAGWLAAMQLLPYHNHIIIIVIIIIIPIVEEIINIFTCEPSMSFLLIDRPWPWMRLTVCCSCCSCCCCCCCCSCCGIGSTRVFVDVCYTIYILLHLGVFWYSIVQCIYPHPLKGHFYSNNTCTNPDFLMISIVSGREGGGGFLPRLSCEKEDEERKGKTKGKRKREKKRVHCIYVCIII